MINHKQVGLLIAFVVVISFGCVGSPVHMTSTYSSIQSTIKKNNKNLLQLKIGMTHEEVLNFMGDPERSEGYSWGTVWLYRTAIGTNPSMTSTMALYGTTDSDYTPVVFNEKDLLIGWGRNFYKDYIERYEIKIEQK